MFLDELQPFAISLLIGLIVGIERERSSKEGEGTMGVRTFSVLALTGTAAAVANSPMLTLGLILMVVTLTTAGYWRATTYILAGGEKSTQHGIGLTSEVAAGLVFALGFLAKANPLLAGILGIVLVTVLYARKRLHMFSREVLQPAEIRAALTLAVFAFVIIPFIPDQTVDPWGIINPRRLAQIMAMIAGLEFAGYVVERFAGQRIGLLATGFFGGLASSTAVFLNLTKMAKSRPEAMSGLFGSGLMANAATILLFVAITAVTSPELTSSVGVPALVCALTSMLLAVFTSKKGEQAKDGTQHDARSKYPLDVRAAAKLGLFIFGLLALTAIVKRSLGSDALLVVSFVSGLFELHGVTYANAALHVSKVLTTQEATVTLLTALVASFISKIFICWSLAAGRFAIVMTGYLLAIIGSGLVTFVVMQGLR